MIAEQKEHTMLLIRESLDRVCVSVPDVQLITLASIDGFSIVSMGNKNNEQGLPGKFAAIASSMGSLGVAAGKEFGATDLKISIFDFSTLHLVLRLVKGKSNHFVLAIAAEKKTALGKLLWVARECTDELEDIL